MGGSSGGGSGGTQSVETTVTNTNIPKEFYPYLQKSLQSADAIMQQDYVPYEGQRLAGYTPEQQAAFQGITGLASRSLPGITTGRAFASEQLIDPTTGRPKGASITDATTSYTAPGQTPTAVTPGRVASTYTAPAAFDSGYRAGDITTSYAPGQITSGFTGANIGTGYTGTEFTQPDLASRIAQFQNPFQEQVLDIAQDRAARAFNQQQAQRNLQATRAGGASAFGARGTLANLEAERGFLDRQAAQEADLLLKGYDKATATALADIDRQLKTQQLTDASRRAAAGLGLQADVATGRFAQAAGAQGLQAQQLTDAAQRALGVQGLQAQQLTDAARRAQGQQTLQALLAADRSAQTADQLGLRADLASEELALKGGEQGIRAFDVGERAKQQAGAQGLQAAIANQRALAQEKARLDTLARFGIDVDRQEQALDLQRLGALQALGADLRADEQRILDTAYQDFLRQRDFPKEQLQFYSGILRGAQAGPMDRTVAQQQPAASQTGQLLNFLLGAAALNRAA